MAVLGTPAGVFNLYDSDRCVGSFISRADAIEIFGVEEEDLGEVQFEEREGAIVVDERKLQKAWYDGNIPNSPPRKNSSMDELILRRLINITLPEARVEGQERIGRFQMDLKVTHNGETKYVEFDGPSHFAPSRYGPPKHHPFRKKKIIEEKTGIEVVNWAYWIQRCASNVRAIFDNTVRGYGALWSTNIHFGDFSAEDSAQVILEISERFGCSGADAISNFYGPRTNGRNNPEHPILSEIIAGKESIERLIPKGCVNREQWVPVSLRDVT